MTGSFLGNTRAVNVVSVTLSPVSVAANTTAEQTFTLPGILLGDYIEVTKPTTQAGLGIVNDRVSAANTIALTFSNNTASPIVPTAAESYTVLVVRPEVVGATTIMA